MICSIRMQRAAMVRVLTLLDPPCFGVPRCSNGDELFSARSRGTGKLKDLLRGVSA